jgi:hypothetical protein
VTQRPSVHRRIAASILGADRSGRRPPTVEEQRRLPVKRRILASLLGVRVRPPAPRASVTAAAADAAAPAPTRPVPERTARVDHPEYSPEPVPRPSPPPRRATWQTAPAGRTSVSGHLLIEDRQEYERILDEALRSAPDRPELAAVGQRLNSEQLRTMALNATSLITASAATEYLHYVKVREEVRGSAEPDETALAADRGEVEATGAGVGAVLAVLTPVLFGTAAVIFLLVGYILKMLDPEPAFARTMLTTGWVFGAMTAASVLVAAVGLVFAALRNRPSTDPRPYGDMSEEVARAREAWHGALLERGVLPFLREALADPGVSSRTTASSRVPHVGYSRPDFTSPDFGGPEERQEHPGRPDAR